VSFHTFHGIHRHWTPAFRASILRQTFPQAEAMMQKDPVERAISNTLLRCLECGQLWIEATERWRTYLSNDDPRQTLTYCPECALREFG